VPRSWLTQEKFKSEPLAGMQRTLRDPVQQTVIGRMGWSIHNSHHLFQFVSIWQ